MYDIVLSNEEMDEFYFSYSFSGQKDIQISKTIVQMDSNIISTDKIFSNWTENSPNGHT